MCADIEKSVFLKCVLQAEKVYSQKELLVKKSRSLRLVCESSKSYAKKTGKQISDREI